MAYQKINKYPSYKTRGVYPSGSFKQLGLDSDDLKKFSLGNWTSVMRGDFIFTYRETQQDEVLADPRGRPIQLRFDENRFNIGISRIECREEESGIIANSVQNVQRPTNSSIATLGTRGNVPSAGLTYVTEGYATYPIPNYDEVEEKDRHMRIWRHYVSGSFTVEVDPPTQGQTTNEYDYEFFNTEFRPDRVMDLPAFIVGEADGNIIKVQFFDDDGNVEMNPGQMIKKNQYDDDDLTEQGPDGKEAENFFADGTNNNTEFFFPTFLYISTVGSNTYSLGEIISIPRLSSAMGYGSGFFVFDISNTTLGDSLSDSSTEEFDFMLRLGFPNFQFNPQISSETPTADEQIDFKVEVKTQEGNELIYHDRKENLTEYIATSYPIEATLSMSLYDNQNFPNELGGGDVSAQLSDLYYLPEDVDVSAFLDDFSISVDESYFTYQVIQWGDESVLLSDDEIQNTFFFSLYDSDEYPSDDNYFLRKSIASQSQQAIGIQNQSNHVYNTPGVKSIKIIVYRYDNTQSLLLQTYLITKNIVINDGVLTSQDFSIFGGSDFTFLPIVDNQAIIGGFDEESKYNKSVEKITKDDDFIAEDYLQRASSRDYIEKFNDSLLGKRPGQLDLGQVRLFNQPRDLYDFIGGDKLQWITNGSGSLQLNSSATDIFIKDDNCLVDLNPSNSEFSVLQNQVGLKDVGVLTGDYKLNQPKNSRVQKQGLMEVPLLDDNVDKQAF